MLGYASPSYEIAMTTHTLSYMFEKFAKFLKSKTTKDTAHIPSAKNEEKSKEMANATNLKDIKLTTAQLNQLKVKRQFEIIIEEANWDRCDQNGNP